MLSDQNYLAKERPISNSRQLKTVDDDDDAISPDSMGKSKTDAMRCTRKF